MIGYSKRLNFFLLSSFYVGGLSFIYAFETTAHWSGQGFELQFSFAAFLLVCVSLVSLPFIIPLKHDARSLLVNAYIFIHFLPTLVILVFGRFLYSHAISLWLGLTIMLVASSIKYPTLIFSFITHRSFNMAILLLTVMVLFVLYIELGFGSFNLNIWKVYDFRGDIGSQLSDITVTLSSLLSKVLLPIALIFSFQKKQFLLLTALLCITIAVFGFTQQKSSVAGPVTALLLYVVLSRSKSSNTIGYFLGAIVIIGLGEYVVQDVLMNDAYPNPFSTLVIRRVLFLPTLLDSYYIDYFGGQTKIYWSGLIDSVFYVRYPYPTTPPFLIAQQFFDRGDMSANTGFIGSGYANGGLFGVGVYAAIIGFIIGFINAQSNRLGAPFVTSVSLFGVTTAFITSDLVTSLLSHGVLALLILLMIAKPAIGKTSKTVSANHLPRKTTTE